MSFKKQGLLSKSPGRLKYLKDFLSRLFWKGDLNAEKEITSEELTEAPEDIENLNDQFNELIKTLIALSSAANRQRAIYGEAPPGDEMAEDFNSYFTRNKSLLLDKGLIDQEAFDLLGTLARFMDVKSAENDLEFWDDLEQHKDWEMIRELARLCLVKLGKEKYRLQVEHQYGRDDNGRVTSQVTKAELLK